MFCVILGFFCNVELLIRYGGSFIWEFLKGLGINFFVLFGEKGVVIFWLKILSFENSVF